MLISVCHALAFAHSRGVIHRDIKPANVMVGAFGEVTLLDWGIALRLGSKRGPARVLGTPGYMAPEMLHREPLSVRTDIYLLGATLYELLTGAPPHPGNNLHTRATSEAPLPSLPERVPATLAALCLAALSIDPADRPATVAEVRGQLEAFLEHRAVESLVRTTQKRVSDLRAAIAAEASERAVIEGLASCRLGFAQALELWPEHPSARAHLDEALHLVCRWALTRGKLELATHHLAQTSVPDPGLTSAVAEARAGELERVRALEAQHRADEAGQRRLMRLALPLGLPVIAMTTWLSLDAKPGYLMFGATSLVALLMILVAASRTRGDLRLATLAGRYLAVLAAIPILQTLVDVGAWLRGWPPHQAHSVVMVVVMTACSSLGLLHDRRYLVFAALWAGLWIVSSLVPDLHYMLMSAGVGGMVLLTMAPWSTHRAPRAREGG